ncbi:MAG TPA: TonB-dependent receptor [Allosphingosinicella sp.]|nr:TonB-dependent receptor [Allosphingosinicella sp.]
MPTEKDVKRFHLSPWLWRVVSLSLLQLVGITFFAQASQAKGEDVVREADDAFGVRIGLERFGLYTESFARGFSLEAAANYRLDGHYFVPAANPINSLIESATVRVGVNSLPFDFPPPSGMVDYALRGPAKTAFVTARAGSNRYASPFAEIDFSVGKPSLGVAGGIQAYPSSRFADGGVGSFFSVGFVPQWQPSPKLRIRGLIGIDRFRYNGDVGFVTAGADLPPVFDRSKPLGPENARVEQRNANLGLMVDQSFDRARLGFALFYSRRELPRADFTLISGLDRQGRGQAAFFTAPDQRRETWSGDANVVRQLGRGTWQHRVTASLRGRFSHNRAPAGQQVPLGEVIIDGRRLGLVGNDRPEPTQAYSDRIEQVALGVGYRISYKNRIEARTGLQRMRYSKEAQAVDGTVSSNISKDWLFNLSAAAKVGKALTLYAAATRGIEETGLAPARALNRNEVLPAVKATQIEAGSRLQASKTFNVSAAVFQITKPTPEFGTDDIFRLVGDARYRGLEASANWRFDQSSSLVIGAVLIDADRKRLRGEPTRNPVGVAEQQGLIGLSYQPRSFRALTLDGQLTVQGGRWADTANTIKTRSLAVLDLGARYAFGTKGPQLRVQIINVSDVKRWVAQPSQTLVLFPPRTFRLVLSQSL